MSVSLHISPSSVFSAPKPLSQPLLPIKTSAHVKQQNEIFPTIHEIMEEASRTQKLRLHLHTLGPFFRVRATSCEDGNIELGRAEGVVKPWIGGNILHLDSIRMRRAPLSMDRSIFGLGLFVGAVAIRHGYDNGCRKAELLAIYDNQVYHSKLVRFYTRMGFKAVREVDGMSFADLPHMLVWGGKGTRMDANIEELIGKWSKRFKPSANA